MIINYFNFYIDKIKKNLKILFYKNSMVKVNYENIRIKFLKEPPEEPRGGPWGRVMSNKQKRIYKIIKEQENISFNELTRIAQKGINYPFCSGYSRPQIKRVVDSLAKRGLVEVTEYRKIRI